MNDQLASYAAFVGGLFPQCELQSLVPLSGGVSAQAARIRLRNREGVDRSYVVRRHSAVDSARNPRIAQDEFHLLHALGDAGLPVPRPVLFDSSRHWFPEPVIVLEYVEGTTEIPPGSECDRAAMMGRVLATVHKLDLHGLLVRFLPAIEGPLAEIMARQGPEESSTGDRTIIQYISKLPHQPAVPNPEVLLHGDFWTGNILWHAGEIVAILDWEDAAIGDPLADLAKCRTELLAAFGAGARDAMTMNYFHESPHVDDTNLPWWDIAMAMRMSAKLPSFGLDSSEEERFRSAIGAVLANALDDIAPSR